MRRLTIAGLIAALTLGTFVVVASAQEIPGVTSPPNLPSRPTCGAPNNPCWPGIAAEPVFKPGEWYSDVPWHQKLAQIMREA
jgi:hypothetical protein